mmetsp:Transcript_5326/g.11281  ORF Transcript_5326/g.11281 Transcript_5326/m.11281 type:complete len:131 (+) Transcript_5326:858-1250(+)
MKSQLETFSSFALLLMALGEVDFDSCQQESHLCQTHEVRAASTKRRSKQSCRRPCSVGKGQSLAFKEVKLQKAMGETVQDKMQSAEARKETILKEVANKLSSYKKNLSPREPSGSSLTIAGDRVQDQGCG